MWIKEMFGVEKPIIALLHLDALPGDPGFCGSMDTVLEHAKQDLIALKKGGVDGILFANELSLPYQPVADLAVISATAHNHGRLLEPDLEAHQYYKAHYPLYRDLYLRNQDLMHRYR